MTYTKQTWNDDDPTTPLSADRLSHMEDGIEEVDTHIDDAVDAHDAAAISVNPNGGNVAGNVQASLVAIDAAKVQTGAAVDLTSAQTIGGVKAYLLSPTGPTPTTATQLAPKGYVDSLLGPSGTVTLGADQIFTGKNQFRGVMITNEAVDVRDSRFGGGALFDNSTNDTAAIQAAIDHAGTTVTARAGNLTFPEGTAYIDSTLLWERKAINTRGQGWGPTGSLDGTTFRWGGNNTTPMFRVRQGMGSTFENFRLLGNKTVANCPTAGINFDVQVGNSQPNTFFTVERVWFGRFSGYDDTGTALGAGGNYLQAGITTSGQNEQNDQSRFPGNIFYQVGIGVDLTLTQAVLNHFESCFFWHCQTGIRSVAQVMLTNTYFSSCTVRDLHAIGDRITCHNYTSESAHQMAKLGNSDTTSGELFIHTGYFQVGMELNASGHIIDDINDSRSVIDLTAFDFRENDAYTDAEVALTRPRAKLAIRTANIGQSTPKNLGLHHVNYGPEGQRWGFTADRLDIDPGRAGNGLDTLTIYGMIQTNPAGVERSREIYNYLHYLNPTANFSRNDRETPIRVKAGAPSDADYLVPPPIGTPVLDSSSNRLYVRTGVGMWRYTALT